MNPETSTQRVRRATWVGLVANVVLATGKVTAGIVGGSAAVVADGVHSVSDLVTDLALLVGTHFWDQPPDEQHPHGHRRIETLVTAGIGFSLAAVGIGMGWRAITDFQAPRLAPTTSIALVAALVSVVVKEWLFRWTRVQGELADSPALVANAWHHRSDAFSSIPAVVAVATEMVFPDMVSVDRIGVLAICVFSFSGRPGGSFTRLCSSWSMPAHHLRSRLVSTAWLSRWTGSVRRMLCVPDIRVRSWRSTSISRSTGT